MTETAGRARGRRGRRVAALAGAIGLVLVGVLAAGPAAAAAEPIQPVPISEELVTDVSPEVGPVTDEAIVPINEAIVPVSEESGNAPLVVGAWIGIATAVAGGGLAILAAVRAKREPVVVRSK